MPDEFVLVFGGDSKVKGIGATYGMLGMAKPVGPGVLGAGYTRPDDVTLSGATDGTGGEYAARLVVQPPATASNGTETVFPVRGGTGYVDESKAPILTLSQPSGATGAAVGAGGGPTTAANFQTLYAGGLALRMEAAIKAAGGNVRVLNLGFSGASVGNLDVKNGWLANAMQGALSQSPRSALYLSCGVNDASAGVTAEQMQLLWESVIAGFPGIPIFLARTCGVPNPSYPNAAAINNLVQAYGAVVDTVVANHPERLVMIQDEFALMASHPEFFGKTAGSPDLHQNDAGYDYMAQDVAPRLISSLQSLFRTSFGASSGATNTDPSYTSAASNEVTVVPGYIPSAPIITSYSGLGTFLAPQVALHWTAGTWGAIDVERLTVGAPGAAGTYAKIGSVVGTTVGDPTTVPLGYVDHTVVNGVTYKYRVKARPDYTA